MGSSRGPAVGQGSFREELSLSLGLEEKERRGIWRTHLTHTCGPVSGTDAGLWEGALLVEWPTSTSFLGEAANGWGLLLCLGCASINPGLLSHCTFLERARNGLGPFIWSLSPYCPASGALVWAAWWTPPRPPSSLGGQQLQGSRGVVCSLKKAPSGIFLTGMGS